MSRTDMLVTQNTEDNFHCQACHSQLMGCCEPCGMTGTECILEFETFVDGALKLVEREGPHRSILRGLLVERVNTVGSLSTSY